MASSRFNSPFFQSIDGATGAVGAGWKLYFYESGSTSTPLATYSDEALTVPNPNPVISDAGGFWGDIFLSDNRYNVLMYDAEGVLRDSADPVGRVGSTVLTDLRTSALTIAEMTADVDAVLGDRYMVWDYTANNRSPVMFFKVVAAGTGIVDGLNYINHDTLNLQFEQALPAVYNTRHSGSATPAPVSVTDLRTVSDAAADFALAAALDAANHVKGLEAAAAVSAELDAYVLQPAALPAVVAGNDVLATGNGGSITSTSYVRMDEFRINRAGTYRLVRTQTGDNTNSGFLITQTWKNGAPYGPARDSQSTTATTYMEDIPLVAGDTIAVYAKKTANLTGTLSNVNLKYSAAAALVAAYWVSGT